jgi:hypothetical protein
MAINIQVDQDRMSKLVTIDEYLALTDGDVRTMVNVLSKFVIGDNGEYLDEKDGRKLIGSLTIDGMREVVAKFVSASEDIVVHPSTGAA